MVSDKVKAIVMESMQQEYKEAKKPWKTLALETRKDCLYYGQHNDARIKNMQEAHERYLVTAERRIRRYVETGVILSSEGIGGNAKA